MRGTCCFLLLSELLFLLPSCPCHLLRCLTHNNGRLNRQQLPPSLHSRTQVLYSQDEYVTDPILAAVGQLQFEVRVRVRNKCESAHEGW